MARANRSHRSKRRSRRRQLAMVCGALSYLAIFASVLLALLSIVAHTGPAAVAAFLVGVAFVLLALVCWAADVHAAHSETPTRAHTV